MFGNQIIIGEIMKTLGIIPSRIGSQRLPKKPLLDICGKSLIQRTYESCKKSLLLDNIIVATDSEEIYNHVINFGGKVEMTKEHSSGTARMIEVAERQLYYDAYLNIQGDHPLVDIEHIDSLIIKLQKLQINKTSSIVTPIVKFKNTNDTKNIHAVKVVINQYNEALYFSRSEIPFVRNTTENVFWKHIGLYGFNKFALKDIKDLPISILESVEMLEQLTWLYHGLKIHCIEVNKDVLSVDVLSDLELVKNVIEKKE